MHRENCKSEARETEISSSKLEEGRLRALRHCCHHHHTPNQHWVPRTEVKHRHSTAGSSGRRHNGAFSSGFRKVLSQHHISETTLRPQQLQGENSQLEYPVCLILNPTALAVRVKFGFSALLMNSLNARLLFCDRTLHK